MSKCSKKKKCSTHDSCFSRHLIYASLRYLRYKLWFCRAKDYIWSLPIRTPPSRYCISRLALCILNCTLTIQTPFQKRLFVFFISFRRLKSETNYGVRNHRYTLVFQFFLFYSRSIFTFRNPHTFCIPKTPLCVHKLGFNIPNSTMKFKADFLLWEKRHSKLQFYISNSKPNTVFWCRNCIFTFRYCLSIPRIQKHIPLKNCVFRYSKAEAELWHRHNFTRENVIVKQVWKCIRKPQMFL